MRRRDLSRVGRSGEDDRAVHRPGPVAGDRGGVDGDLAGQPIRSAPLDVRPCRGRDPQSHRPGVRTGADRRADPPYVPAIRGQDERHTQAGFGAYGDQRAVRCVATSGRRRSSGGESGAPAEASEADEAAS